MTQTCQLLHIVIGGDLVSLDGACVEFRDLKNLDYVGAFPNYEEARQAWKAKAQATVDNALRRYFVLHAHRLLDPSTDAK